jgi:hypothetical protein
MLDLNGLVSKQKEGDRLLQTLTHDEEVVLQNYCLAAAQAVTKAGMAAQQTTNNIILNAFRTGLALGLGIDIAASKVRPRLRPQ